MRWLSFLFCILLGWGCVVLKAAPIAVVCSYDYSRALITGNNRMKPHQAVPIHYLTAVPVDEDVQLTRFVNFTDMMRATRNTNNLLVFVHGDGDNIDYLVKYKSMLPDQYDADVLCFAWPSLSERVIRRYNYRLSEQNCDLVFARFLEMMDSVEQYVKGNDITCTVMFHSLGNRFAKLYANYLLQHSNGQLFIDNIILNAPSIVEREHCYWVDVLNQSVKQALYVVRNRNDNVLRAVQNYIEGDKMLGRSPLSCKSLKALYVDVTEAVSQCKTKHASHSYYAGDILKEMPILQWFYNSIFSNNIDLDTCNRFTKRDTNYYILNQNYSL